MNKEQENQFKEYIKEMARLELKNGFTDNLMETLNSAFIFKYVDTLEKQNKQYKEVIDKANKYINNNLIISSILDGKKYYTLNNYSFDYRELLEILKDKEVK